MFWDKDEKLIKVNNLAIKENLAEGIELKAGMHVFRVLTKQFRQDLYSVPKNLTLKILFPKA